MNRHLYPVTAGALVAALAFAWAPSARADESAARRPSPTVIHRQASPEPIFVTPGGEQGTYEEERPNVGLITTGIVTLGLSYGASAVVASTSPREEDRHLYVPVAGPWMNLARRSCPGGEAACANENTYKVLLVADGIFQGLGALEILGGLLMPETRTVAAKNDKSPPATAFSPTIHVTPAHVGYAGYGISAFGTF